jgi:hypothetical protein
VRALAPQIRICRQAAQARCPVTRPLRSSAPVPRAAQRRPRAGPASVEQVLQHWTEFSLPFSGSDIGVGGMFTAALHCVHSGEMPAMARAPGAGVHTLSTVLTCRNTSSALNSLENDNIAAVRHAAVSPRQRFICVAKLALEHFTCRLLFARRVTLDRCGFLCVTCDEQRHANHLKKTYQSHTRTRISKHTLDSAGVTIQVGLLKHLKSYRPLTRRHIEIGVQQDAYRHPEGARRPRSMRLVPVP